jgi:hypothetical protein
MRTLALLPLVAAVACGSSSRNLCGELVEDTATGSCRCPDGTRPGGDGWTCLLPDGGVIRDPNAPDATVDAGADADVSEPDAGSDAGLDAGSDAGLDAGDDDAGTDGGCPERVWYRDRDRDGFGVDDDTTTGCTAPDGYVAEGGDCDDTCTACTPFASEICDGRDNDCDDSVDEALPQVTCYRDRDGDGFGDEETTMMACGCPDGWTQRSDLFDCGDATPNAFPGQTMYFSESYCPGNGVTLVCARGPDGEFWGGSFDYNCDGREQARYGHYVGDEDTDRRGCALGSDGVCRPLARLCCVNTCGEELDRVTMCTTSGGLCGAATERVTQPCR